MKKKKTSYLSVILWGLCPILCWIHGIGVCRNECECVLIQAKRNACRAKKHKKRRNIIQSVWSERRLSTVYGVVHPGKFTVVLAALTLNSRQSKQATSSLEKCPKIKYYDISHSRDCRRTQTGKVSLIMPQLPSVSWNKPECISSLGWDHSAVLLWTQQSFRAFCTSTWRCPTIA